MWNQSPQTMKSQCSFVFRTETKAFKSIIVNKDASSPRSKAKVTSSKCYAKKTFQSNISGFGMHEDSTSLIIKRLLRYSQHNLFKYGMNNYGKITLAKILGHFPLVIICWDHYRCQSKHQSQDPLFITIARWNRRINSCLPRRIRTSQRQNWEHCCCLAGSWGKHLSLIEQRDTHVIL